MIYIELFTHLFGGVVVFLLFKIYGLFIIIFVYLNIWVYSQFCHLLTLTTYRPTDVVDPNRDGQVSLQEYMAFMISKETENVQTSEEIENAFRAITAHQDRAYVTKDELYAVSTFAFLGVPFEYAEVFNISVFSGSASRYLKTYPL